MSPAQPAMPPSGFGRARVWIMPPIPCRNQAGEPLAAGPDDAASLVCEKANVPVSKLADREAAQLKIRCFISSSPWLFLLRGAGHLTRDPLNPAWMAADW